MGVKDAIKILRRDGWTVKYDKPNDQYILTYPGDPEPGYCKTYTPRELISYARHSTHHGKGNTKHYDHRRDRHKTKQKIDHEEYDDLSHNKQTHREDRWNWD